MLVGAFSKLTLQNGLTNQNVSLNNAFFLNCTAKLQIYFYICIGFHQIIIINNKKNNE